MTEIQLNVSGMTCSGCAAAVQQALLGVTGVATAEVNPETGEARIEATGVDIEEILMAVKLAGYEAAVK